MAEERKSDREPVPLEIEGVADRVSSANALELINDIEIDLKEKLPKQEQGKVMRVVREVVEKRAAFFSGPQPPPELIAEYERVAPGWGIKILEMGEREQLHRHHCDKTMLAQNDRELNQNDSWIQYLNRGQLFGLIAMVLVGGIGVYALFLHETTAACMCFGTFAIGAITAFVKGPNSKESAPEAAPSKSENNATKAAKKNIK